MLVFVFLAKNGKAGRIMGDIFACGTIIELAVGEVNCEWEFLLTLGQLAVGLCLYRANNFMWNKLAGGI